jgi:hypothetical protein
MGLQKIVEAAAVESRAVGTGIDGSRRVRKV